MTNQEAYEKVREACIRANPEIVELKFGCRFKAIREIVEGAGNGVVISDDISLMNCDGGHRRCDTSLIHYEKGRSFEIIGRDIRLADVLLATVGENYRGGWDSDYVNDIVRLWNLKHDSLEWHRDNQPKTVQALAEIIG